MGGAWNYLCGAGIIFGTYFLWILGPKSLAASEGSALWIAQTWPRRFGKSAEGQGLAVVADLYRHGGAGAVLRRDIIPGPSLANFCWLAWPGIFLDGAWRKKPSRWSPSPLRPVNANKFPGAPLGRATWDAHFRDRSFHAAVAARRGGHVYSYITAAAMWQNFRAPLALILRSVVRASAARTHADARDGLDQYFD